MKCGEKCSGPGFDSRQVHQMVSLRRIPLGRLRDYLMGLNMVSTGHGVVKQTAG